MDIAGKKTLSTLIRLVQAGLGGKQNLLIGTEDQVLGFDASGRATPKDMSLLKGEKGDPGGIFYPTLSINPETGTLLMELPEQYSGAVFSISEGKLQMTMD